MPQPIVNKLTKIIKIQKLTIAKNMTEIKVDTKTGSPYIQVSLRFTGRIYSMANNANYLSPEVLETISNSCNSYLELIMHIFK